MIYTKAQAKKALDFWKTKLNESCNEADLPDMEETFKESESKYDSSKSYEPNTVGSLLHILMKLNPKTNVVIKSAPGMNEYMLIDKMYAEIDNKPTLVLTIGQGSPRD